jgi:hypothetical protein
MEVMVFLRRQEAMLGSSRSCSPVLVAAAEHARAQQTPPSTE